MRIRAVNDLFAALDVELEQFAGVRLRSLAHLRRAGGWSYAKLVAATGLSKSRVSQLVHQIQADRST